MNACPGGIVEFGERRTRSLYSLACVGESILVL